MRNLSIFIDESGDFGPLSEHSPYYVLGVVFHDQGDSIETPLGHLRQKLAHLGLEGDHNVHTAPIIRREQFYKEMDLASRQKVFRALSDFARYSPVRVRSFIFDKRSCGDGAALSMAMADAIAAFLAANREFFEGWDKVIIYYDNGQPEITKIVEDVLNRITRSEVRRISVSSYALFQVADLLCTLSLIETKMGPSGTGLSASEESFFRTSKVSARKNIEKVYLRDMRKKGSGWNET